MHYIILYVENKITWTQKYIIIEIGGILISDGNIGKFIQRNVSPATLSVSNEIKWLAIMR